LIRRYRGQPGRRDLLALKRHPAELGVDDPQLLAVKVKLAQQRLHGQLLVRWEGLVGQPAATLDPE
jgi:hypothetical protein